MCKNDSTIDTDFSIKRSIEFMSERERRIMELRNSIYNIDINIQWKRKYSWNDQEIIYLEKIKEEKIKQLSELINN